MLSPARAADLSTPPILIILIFSAVFAALPSAAGAAGAERFGSVQFAHRQGYLSSDVDLSKGDARSIGIEGLGGVFSATPFGSLLLESAGSHGARLELPAPHQLMLIDGILDVFARSTVTIRAAGVSIQARGRAVVTHRPDLETILRMESGLAEVDADNRRWTVSAGEALRVPASSPASIVRLLSPPRLVRPANVLVPPIQLTAELDRENTTEGVLEVACSTRPMFWESARRYLFLPGEPILLTDAPGGPVYIRARTIDRSGIPGVATEVYPVVILDRPPGVVVPARLQTETLRGRLDPPLARAAVRWDHLRVLTAPSGSFEFEPNTQFGLIVSDLALEVSDPAMPLETLLLLSDPDKISVFSAPSGGQPRRAAQLFIRTDQIAIRNTSTRTRLMLNGMPLTDPDTRLAVLPSIEQRLVLEWFPPRPARDARAEGDDRYELSILRDIDGPKILNVSLESRGGPEKFYVLADIVDLGIGLQLPAHAIFESDAGDRLAVPLHLVSDLRLEGRAMSQESDRGRRSRVWWIRIEAADLLGNRTTLEETLFEKRQRKFISIGLKDLVRIWKNKL